MTAIYDVERKILSHFVRLHDGRTMDLIKRRERGRILRGSIEIQLGSRWTMPDSAPGANSA